MIARLLPLALLLLAPNLAQASPPPGLDDEPSEKKKKDPDGDDDDDEEKDKDKAKDKQRDAEEKARDEARKALKKLLLVDHRLGAKNVLSIGYGFSEPKELLDFNTKGFDKAEVNQVESTHKEVALELGAGSRKLGSLIHKVTLRGDFTVKVQLFIPVNPPSAILCFLLGKKVGVKWGQTIVKVRGMRPYNRRRRPDPTKFKEERKCTVTMVRKGTILTVKFNGVETDKRRFKKGELDGIRLGLMARNIRVAITDWEITGVVDMVALSKLSKKKKKKKKKKRRR